MLVTNTANILTFLVNSSSILIMLNLTLFFRSTVMWAPTKAGPLPMFHITKYLWPGLHQRDGHDVHECVRPSSTQTQSTIDRSTSLSSTSSVMITRLMLNLRDPVLASSRGSACTGPSYRFRNNLTTLSVNYTSDYAEDHQRPEPYRGMNRSNATPSMAIGLHNWTLPYPMTKRTPVYCKSA